MSGQEQSDKTTVTQVENQNIPGGDYKFFELKPGETCQACIDACLKDPNCKAYTYVKPGVQAKNAVCWLKSSVSNPVSDPNCISGVKNTVSGQSEYLIKQDIRATSILKEFLNQPTVTKVENQNILEGNEYRKASKSIKISFEEISSDGPGSGVRVRLSRQYADLGITFINDPVVFDYSKASSPLIYQSFAHSGTKAIEACEGQEFCNKPIIMNFTTPQRHIGLWVGYNGNLTMAKTVILTDVSSSDVNLHKILATATLQPSVSPIAIRTYLHSTSLQASITSIQVSFAPNQYGMVSNLGLAIDDIEFDSAGSEPPCQSTANPVVTLTQSPPNQVMRSNKINLQGTVNTTAPLEFAKLTIVGVGGTNSRDLLNDKTISRDGGNFSIYSLQDLLFQGSNKVSVSVMDCMNSGEKSTTIIFQPCDDAISPKVTIYEPNPTAIHNFVGKTTFKLSGKIESIAKITSVMVTVNGEIPFPQSHQFPVQLDNQNVFDLLLGTENLYEGNNTLNITAIADNGCSGDATTKLACTKIKHSSSRIIHISDIHCTSRNYLVDVNKGNIAGNILSTIFFGIPFGGSPYQGDWQNTVNKCNQIVSFLINNGHSLQTNRIVITGDLVDGSEDDYFKTIAKTYLLDWLTSYGFDVIVVPGNHDYFTLGIQRLTSGIDERRTAFFNAFSPFTKTSAPDAYPVDLDIGDGNHLILLDALKGRYDDRTGHINADAQGKIGENQLNWLKNTLPMYQQDRKAGKKIAIALHHSPFETDESIELLDAEEFLDVISNNIDALMFGHTELPHKFYQGYANDLNIPIVTSENIDKMSSTGYPISVIDLNSNTVEVYSTSGGLSGKPLLEKIK